MGEFQECRVRLYEHSKVAHSLFLRQHRVREKVAEKPTDRTIFVSGIPSFFNERVIFELFSNFGNVTTVFIHKTPTPKVPVTDKSLYFRTTGPVGGFMVAYVVFEKARSMEMALDNDKELVVPKDTLCNGFKKWAKEYNDRIPDITEMKREIDNFIKEFDKKDDKKQREEKDATEMDDEGWTTVTKKSRKPGITRKESVMKQLTKKEEKRRQKKELTNFYRFQIKESKMKNLVTLRQKFEEDKKRIIALKATRRFKPF